MRGTEECRIAELTGSPCGDTMTRAEWRTRPVRIEFAHRGFSELMGVTYFKRYRMEIDLHGAIFRPPELSVGYGLVPWSESLLEAHAAAKYDSFCSEVDANVFPCLGEREGCVRLMREITRRDGFLSGATWLLVFRAPAGRHVEYCGTVQGVRDTKDYGADPELGDHAEPPQPRMRDGAPAPGALRLSGGGIAASLSRGDRAELRSDPALSSSWISNSENGLQGGGGCLRVGGAPSATFQRARSAS